MSQKVSTESAKTFAIPPAHFTRESWLEAAVKLLDAEFFGTKNPIPGIYVSVGFAFGHGLKAIGVCHDKSTVEDGRAAIFISPVLKEPMRILDVLLHELVHAELGCEVGHKGPFKKRVKELGLVGKATATTVDEGSELWHKLAKIATPLGIYPHSVIVPRMKKKKAGGGWVRMVSETNEKYKILVSPKTLEEFGAPLDPEGQPMVPVEGDE